MSHDADKLIRQLSLVAFLMAERRPFTARDVKGNVEGYSEMSDEAFARRFYSDRAELTALGVPLTSQRDEFTGEELYTLRSEHYFLDQLELDEDELAALQTALYALEGKFAYAEPLRLALQNLALGRPGFRHAPTATAERVRVTAPDYSPELAARLSKLESAISKQRTIHFRYWSPARERETERRAQPVRAPPRRGRLVRRRPRPRPRRDRGRSGSLASAPTSASRRGASGTSGSRRTSTSRRTASPRPWQIGEPVGVARIGVQGDTAWWVQPHALGCRHRSTTASSRPTTRRSSRSSRWILRQNGRAVPLEPDGAARGACARRLRCCASAHSGDAAGGGPRAPGRRAAPLPSAAGRPGRARALRRPAGAARAPARRVRRRARRRARRRRARRAVLDPARGAPGARSRSSTSSTSAAAATRSTRGRRGHGPRPRRQGALRRRLPQGTQADAARGARDPARDRVRRADDRGRRPHAARARAPEARGDVRPVRARPRRRPRAGDDEEALVATLARRRREAPDRRDRVPQRGRGGADAAARRAVHDRARAALLARPHVGPDGGRATHLPSRPDALGADDPRALRAARGLRPELPLRAALSRSSATLRRSHAGSSSAAHAR